LRAGPAPREGRWVCTSIVAGIRWGIGRRGFCLRSSSWFLARQRARVFGQTTAGASSRKIEYTLKNGLYRVSFPVKAYTGYLDRPIESRGLEPDVPVRPKAQDIAQGRDTVLLAAKSYLLTQPLKP